MISIKQEAYKYLTIQRGMLSDYRDDPPRWVGMYNEMLMSELRMMLPYLPERADNILDIGGGMGGIDVVLNDHYGGNSHVTICDGVNDEPVVAKPSGTFSNAEVAKRFLLANGVNNCDFLDANDVGVLNWPVLQRQYELIVSLKAWCFHIPPETFLPLLKAATIPGKTRLIVDVRNSNEYIRTQALLKESGYKFVDIAYTGVKMLTYVFEAQ